MKTYMIVTNDEYELPVGHDIVGAKAAAEYLGMTVQNFRRCLSSGRWSKYRRYKAAVDEAGTEEMQERRKEERRKEYRRRARVQAMTVDRRQYYRMQQHPSVQAIRIGRTKPYECSYPVIAERSKIRAERSESHEDICREE